MKTSSALLAVALLLSPGTASAQTPPAPLTKAAAVVVPDSLNVFRRFSADGPKTLAFYGEVLGLKTLQPIGQVYNSRSGRRR